MSDLTVEPELISPDAGICRRLGVVFAEQYSVERYFFPDGGWSVAAHETSAFDSGAIAAHARMNQRATATTAPVDGDPRRTRSRIRRPGSAAYRK